MRERISLEERSITAPVADSASFTEGYTQIVETWAKVETQFSGRDFDNVDLDKDPTHKFTIRYRDTVTSETRIRYRDVLYRIMKIDNLEMRQEYLILFAAIDGLDTLEANQ